MKAKPLQNTSIPCSWMRFPEWLLDPNSFTRELFTDEDSAKEYYNLFFDLMNLKAQIEITDVLIKRLAHAEDMYNPCDYSESALKFAVETINRVFNKWSDDFALILRDRTVNRAIFPTIHANYIVGQPVNIYSSDDLKKMSTGDLDWDFLYNHPGTQANFHRMMLAKIIHDETGSTRQIKYPTI